MQSFAKRVQEYLKYEWNCQVGLDDLIDYIEQVNENVDYPFTEDSDEQDVEMVAQMYYQEEVWRVA